MIRALERPLTRRSWIAVGAVTVLVVAAVVAAVLGLDHRADARAVSADRDAVSVQAGDAVAAVFSVSESTWEADRERARARLAEPMASSSASALAGGPPDGVTAVQWEPLHVATVDVDGDAASALVVARVTVTPQTGEPQVRDRAVQVSMVRDGDRWLLSGLDELR